MTAKAISRFSPPCRMPNGLQWTEEGLYVIDQYSDNVYLMDEEGYVSRSFGTPTSNGSGIAYGGGYLWTASTGRNTRRDPHDTDTDTSWIYQLDPRDGRFVNRFPTPDGGGVHGIEWDDGLLWVTAFNPKALYLCSPAKNFQVVRMFKVRTERLHGLARDGGGLWCAHTSDKIIIKYDTETGAEIERIVLPPAAPSPHGLSIKSGVLWYSDINVERSPEGHLLHHAPFIGIVER